jgi:predicted RNase H-like nuclease (RuvC/YqgF family)
MAERNTSKSRRPQAVAASPRAASKAALGGGADALQVAVDRLESRVVELKRERDSLADELAAARAEIATLHAARVDAVNRIDWVIDQLQSVLEDKA